MVETVLWFGAGLVAGGVVGVGVACWRLRDRSDAWGSFASSIAAVLRTGGTGENGDVTAAAALLLLAVVSHVAPEHIADALDQSRGAWDYVCAGIEAAALWLAVGVMGGSALLRAVAAYGAVESAMRPVCRLAFPMTAPPPVLAPGVHLCDVAAGQPLGWASIAAACAVVWFFLARWGR